MPSVVAEDLLFVIEPGAISRPGSDNLYSLLKEWVDAHRAHVEKAFFRDGPKVQWFVVLLSFTGYDDEFERQLSALTLAVANNPELRHFNLEAIAVPKAGEEGLAAFVGSRDAQLGSAL